jgi:hypothetical protein
LKKLRADNLKRTLMFNLDQAISEWRRQMSAGGVKDSAVLDELESHVREDVERQARAGVGTEKAFELAVKKIGPASALRKEFRKSVASVVAEKLMLAAAILVLAFGAFLSMATLILCYQTITERVMGFIVISLSFGTICVWPAFISRLPVIHPKRKLQAAQVACLAAGFAISTFYVQVILPHFDRTRDGLIPAIGFFAIFPIAVGLALAAGLDRAARSRTDQVMA